MSGFVMRRRLSGLEPIDDSGQEALRGVGVGDLVKVKITKMRNPRHHALFFALISLVHRNLPDHVQERLPTVEALLTVLKFKTGWCHVYEMADGELIRQPKSIAFHAMDQTEFSAFFERCCDVIAKEWLPGVTSEELRREAESMLGLRIA